MRVQVANLRKLIVRCLFRVTFLVSCKIKMMREGNKRLFIGKTWFK